MLHLVRSWQKSAKNMTYFEKILKKSAEPQCIFIANIQDTLTAFFIVDESKD